MFRRLLAKTTARLALAALALSLTATVTRAQDAAPGCTTGCSTCVAGCQRFHCPPVLKWCMEGAPRICFQHGCPKPICSPCQAPNWGYYQKCWSPWPWPPDWSHCPVPPPASQVFPGMIPVGQAGHADELLSRPRLIDGN
jgi:hypothetical protein